MDNKSILDELSELENSLSAAAQGKNSIGNTEPDVPVTPTPEPAPAAHVDTELENTTPDAPKVDAPVVTTTQDPKPAVDVDVVVDAWDATDNVPDTKVTSQPVVDFSDIAKVLGKEDIKTKEDLVKVVSEYKTKTEELEKRVNSIPKELEKAIEIANLGGNYLEYLGVGKIDWEKEDPVVLYENYVIDRSADKDGNVDFDKVNEYLDALSDTEKEIRGKELQLQYISHQAHTKSSIENQAKQQRQQFEVAIKTTIDRTDNIAGFKLSQTHKDELFSDIVSGADLKPASAEERVFMAFLKKYFNKVDAFRKTQIRNATLRETLNEAQLPDLRTTASPVTPPATKGFTYDDYIKDLDAKKL